MSMTIRQLFSYLGVSKNGKRDIYSIYGYNNTTSFKQFYELFEREAVANRICKAIANSSWRDGFEIESSEKAKEVIETLKGKFLKEIERADILNRIGRYSLLYVGVPDGRNSKEEIGVINPNQLDEIYFKAYSEDGAQITNYDTDVKSKRCGMPLMYSLSVSSLGEKENINNSGTKQVHWSRVIHLAEGALDNDIEGISCLKPVLNDLLDLRKVTGGSAEAYYRNARPKMHFNAKDGFNNSMSEADRKDLADKTEQFNDDFLQVIRTNGIDVNVLNTPHASPLDTVKVILWNISGCTGIPIRVLTGEGAGQLAGSTDRESYNQLIDDRQKTFCTEKVNDFIELLKRCGIVDKSEEVEIIFNKAGGMSEVEQAEVSNKKADTLVKLSQALNDVNGGVNGYIDVAETLKDLGYKVSEEV